MNTVRSAKITALLFILVFFIHSIASLVSKDVGGVYVLMLAPFWIFFPGFLGLAMLNPQQSDYATGEDKSHIALRAKSFLVAIAIDALLCLAAHLQLGGSAATTASFAFVLLLSPLIFFIAYSSCYFQIRKSFH